MTYHGLKGLKQAELPFVHIRTLGSARFIVDMGQASYNNYASTRDPVPALANFNYLSARRGHVNGVTFIEGPNDSLFDHRMDSPTYINASERIKMEFRNGFK